MFSQRAGRPNLAVLLERGAVGQVPEGRRPDLPSVLCRADQAAAGTQLAGMGVDPARQPAPSGENGLVRHLERMVVSPRRIGHQDAGVHEGIRKPRLGVVPAQLFERRASAGGNPLVVDFHQVRKQRVQRAIVHLSQALEGLFGLGLDGTGNAPQRIVVLQREPPSRPAAVVDLVERKGH